MSFRQFGGLQFASKNNIVNSNINTSNILQVSQYVGQPNSYITFLSDISGNIQIYGNLIVNGILQIQNFNSLGNGYVGGDLNVSGSTTLSTLTTTGNATIIGDLNISGGVDITGPVIINTATINTATINTATVGTINSVSIGVGTSYNNLLLGQNAFASNQSGNQNVAIGNESLYSNTSGYDNTSIGYQSLYSNTTGYANLSMGTNSSYNITNGYQNTAIGTASLYSCNTGINNTSIGSYSMFGQMFVGGNPGSNNTALGAESLYFYTNGSSYNTVIGVSSLSTVDGSYNVVVGANSGSIVVGANSGSIYRKYNYNTFLGADTDASQDNTQYSTAIGYNAIVDASNTIMMGGRDKLGNYPIVKIPSTVFSNDTSTGALVVSGGVGIGGVINAQSINVNTINYVAIGFKGTNNLFLGYNASYSITTGRDNLAIGNESLYSNTTGDRNISLGYTSLYNITSGSNNVGIGIAALSSGTTANNNVAIGYNVLRVCNGNENVAIGIYSGLFKDIPNSNSYNTLLGTRTDTLNDNTQYSTAIGYNAIVDASNTIMMGGLNNLGNYPIVKIPCTTDSINTTTGALVVSGGVGIAKKLYVGTSVTANNVVLTSDYRIKENVKNLDTSYVVDNLRPVSYKNTKTNELDIGLIAHELQEHYPFLVHGEKDGEKMQSVNYIGLIGVLINEIKGLKNEIKIIKEQLPK